MGLKRFFAVLLIAAMLAGCAPAGQIHVHTYSGLTVPVSCTQDGYAVYTCACGDSYVEEGQKASGHRYESETVEPTAEREGYTEHICSVCADTYRDSYTPRLEKPVDSDQPSDTPDNPPADDPPAVTPPVDTPVMPPPVDSGAPMPFFNDAAFIGDSISLQLQRYHAATGVFCGATFLTMGSYSVHHAVNGSMKLTYRGQQMSPEDALAASGVNKVFILLGMNDVGWYGVPSTMEMWKVLIQRIREKCPNITIYIQSGTPIFIGGEIGALNNATMNWYNSELAGFAMANDCQYIDIATCMMNSAGGLREDFCSDSYVHLNDDGCVAWVSVLRAYVGG